MNNKTDRKPESFDWVTARAKCTAAEIFTKLKMMIETDVEIRNSDAIRQKNTTKFSIVATVEERFVVVAQQYDTQKKIIFALKGQQIEVSALNGPLFTATVTLSDDGECRAKVLDQEYDLWQLRKKALESLFFPNYRDDQ
jgi:hypothetical protein